MYKQLAADVSATGSVICGHDRRTTNAGSGAVRHAMNTSMKEFVCPSNGNRCST